MKGIQTTTGLGIGGIGTGITNLLSQFGDCKINEVFEILPTLNFNSFSGALLLILAGALGMVHNENTKVIGNSK